jgi:hypothetical protein
MDIAGREPPEGRWWDGEATGREAGEPRLAAGYGLTRHHGLEAGFAAPLYASRPSAFQDPVLRPSTAGETARLVRALGEAPALVVAFGADAGGPGLLSCLIAAERLEVRPEGVRRPPRARAQPAPGPRDWPGPPLPTD